MKKDRSPDGLTKLVKKDRKPVAVASVTLMLSNCTTFV